MPLYKALVLYCMVVNGQIANCSNSNTEDVHLQSLHAALVDYNVMFVTPSVAVLKRL